MARSFGGHVSLALLVLAAKLAAQGGAPSWAEVRTLLEANCLRCHGGESVKSEFRLATAATFASGGSRGLAFDPERPENSRLLEVIRYSNPDLAMPPDGRLPDDAIATLERWILAGAPWPAGTPGQLADPERFPADSHSNAARSADWWAYRPVEPSDAPGDGNPIDAFLASKRAEHGLTAATAAEPTVLLRRATFDLIGVPPSPAERETFLGEVAADGIDAAWHRLIDRLLADPRYGEHWARHWLDLVRYAETNGYERDSTKRNIWRYRDWVIRAFNADKPYDRFVLEQLAGDELATYAPELIEDANDAGPQIATGYFRLMVWDDEPADRKQAKADEIADIVDTTAQVFLASSVGCARCHDHKADPITQRDYFSLTAVFNNIRGYGGAHMIKALADEPEGDRIQPAERDRRLAAIDADIAPLVTQLREAAGDRPTEETAVALLRDARSKTPPSWRYVFGRAPRGWQTPGFDDSAWELGTAGFGTRGTPGAVIGTEWRSKRIQMRTRFALTEIPASLVLEFHHDEDIEVFINGERVFARRGFRTDYDSVQLDRNAVNALVVGSNVIAVSCRQSGGGQFVDVGLWTGWLDSEPAGRIRLEAEAEQWLGPERAGDARRLLQQRRQTARLPVADAYPALVVTEHGSRAPVQHVMLRGSVHALGDEVPAGVPAVFDPESQFAAPSGDAPSDAPDATTTGRRLAFAQWLIGPARGFTARVMANRLWQFHFGRGLSRSPGDFGHLGERPTHPRLLDHLAGELISRGWSLKAMHRYLMSSAAYRMDSTITDAKAQQQDPRNDFYWRFDPRRMTAEQFRDSLLAVSGGLQQKLHGPSVYPPMPPEVLATSSRPGAAWGKSSPEDAARRSVYVFAKRSLRMPLLEGMDQPDPDLPCSDRFPTNVPTQALMTLNGAFAHEQAAKFANRLEHQATEPEAQVRHGLLLAFSREPRAGEVARHLDFLETLQSEHGMSATAALTTFCLTLFNLNEFLWID